MIVNESEFDTQLLQGIKVALRKARELGYPVEQMDVTASVSDGRCSVYFTPIPAPGTIVAGSDLSMKVDPGSQNVACVKRGQ